MRMAVVGCDSGLFQFNSVLCDQYWTDDELQWSATNNYKEEFSPVFIFIEKNKIYKLKHSDYVCMSLFFYILCYKMILI